MKKLSVYKIIAALGYLCLVPLLTIWSVLARKKQFELIWGPIPIINNKYWSLAMRVAGWKSKTLMSSYYTPINKREDFDLYYSDLAKHIRPALLRRFFEPCLAHLYVVKHARVMHLPFSGGPLGNTVLWRMEAFLYRIAGVRTVLIPYGADIYMYSRVSDPTVRHGLLLSYPDAARDEAEKVRHITYWVKHADLIIMGFTMDGISRWDVPSGNMVCIDLEQWKPKQIYSPHDGKTGKVKILHTPNHRGVKGSEFISRAVEELRDEGLNIELKFIERMANDKVREEMHEVDILADQIILPGYGLNAIEGMATGLPVISNLDDPVATRVFRRYSFLNECPIVSATPETIKQVLRRLVTDPLLRKQLGLAGREYAEKYHSYEMVQYLFSSVYKKILDGESVDLMNLFHPLKSPFNKRCPEIRHPLVESRLPEKRHFQC